MIIFKRLVLLLFVFAFLGFTKHSQAQTTCSLTPTLSLDTSVNPNPKDNPLNKVYTLKINNPNKTNCTYRLKASSRMTNWSFLFHPVKNESTTLPNDNITVPQESCDTALCNEKRQFKVRATPKIQPSPGTYKFRVDILPPLGKDPSSLTLVSLDYVVIDNPPTKTFKFTGYPFIDDGGGVAVKAGNGIHEKNEKCLKGNYTIQLDGTNKNFVGKEDCSVSYSVNKSSTANSLNIKLFTSSDFIPTKLSFILQSNPAQVVSGSSVNIPGSANVNFGLKENTGSCKKLPKVDIKPISHEGKKGDKRKYTITINNEDKKNDDNCKADTFTLKADAINDPNNKWKKFEFEGGNKLTIKPGEDKPKGLFVTSPNNAQKGVKDLRLTVNSEKHQTKNVSFTYKVVTSDDGGGGGGGGDKCTPEKPKLEASADKNSVKPGGKITYTVKVKNVDRGPCDKRNLNLQRVLPNDKWTGAWDKNNQFEIAKGVEKTFKLEVKSPNNATVGTKKITINLKKNAGDVINKKEVDFVISSAETPTVCVKKLGFSVTPDSITAKPGKAVAYTIVTKNNDTGPCAKRSLSLKAKLPTSWRAVFAKESFDLEKGGQATLNVAITSPTNAPDGTNTIAIDLNNASGQIVKTQNVNYIVSASQTGETILKITIGADGLGTTKRIPLGGNKNPDPDSTNLDVFLYSASSNTRAFEVNTTFTYDPDPKKEKLVGTISLPSGFPNGVYNLYAIGPQYKLTQLPGSITLTGVDKTIENDNFNLITGDINKTGISYNNIDSLDYHVLLSCSIYSQDSETCDKDPNYKEYSDLNYDGIVNEDDFTLWLKEVGNQEGAQFPDQ